MHRISFSSNSLQFSLTNLISPKDLSHFVADTERFRVFDPSTTLFCFLFQVVNNCSLKSALLNLNLIRKKEGLKAISMNTAALCKAKKRLCLDKIKTLVLTLGEELDSKSSFWKFKGRDVLLGDGTIITLENTERIKKEFPISKNRSGGVIPRMRVLTFFSASSGCLIDAEVGKFIGKGQSETGMLKKIIKRLGSNSIFVLDRFYTSFDTRKCLMNYKNDYVIREREVKAKKVLGRKGDVEIEEKPKVSEYGTIPIKTRYIKSTIKRDGFRTASIYIVTSLLSDKGYSKKDIEQLYLMRWGVELDLRNLKSTLEGSHLKSKSASMCLKELWVYFLAYNLIKKLSNKSCEFNQKHPRKQSFKLYLEVLKRIYWGGGKEVEANLYKIVGSEFLNSKYRREPRAVIREKGKYHVMRMPRNEAKLLDWPGLGKPAPRATATLEASK